MKESEIIEGNKLIAEFMGKSIIAATSEDLPHSSYDKKFNSFADCQKFCDGVNMRSDVNKDSFSRTYFPIHKRGRMKYHESWDWLMPVVEKINSICSKNGEELSNHSKDQEHLFNKLDNPLHWKSWSYHHIRLSTNIDSVWLAVVEFIKWFNQHPQPHE